MKKILRRSKSKGKAAAADASSVVSADGVTSVQIGEYVVKEKDLPKIHKAAWTGDINKIRSLANKRQDLNALDKANRTPLHLACYNGHGEVVKFLVANGVKLNICDGDQRSPLTRAIQTGKFDISEHLLRQNADPSLIDINGDTAIHIAVYSGQQDAVRLLVSYGAMVDGSNKQGSTPLHIATALANVEILEVLLQKDADVNVQDNSHRTPLMLACQADQIGIVKMLLEYQADPNIRDQKGWTANDHAIMGGFHGCSHLIEERQTMKRAPSGGALSGTGLFGSTTNSTDALGFPLTGAAAASSDISGDIEDDLSINRKSDDESSWAASNSEFDEPPKQSQQKLPGIRNAPPIKKMNNDLRDQGKPQVTPRNDIMRELDSLEQQSLQDGFHTGRDGHRSEVIAGDDPTPRGRSQIVSSGSMSDWDDESDILDDLSEKKGPGIFLMRGNQKSSPEVLPSPSPVFQQEGNQKGNSGNDVSFNEEEDPPSEDGEATPRGAEGPVTDQPPPTMAPRPTKVPDDVFENDSDSDWDSEADDILPSDNSATDVAAGYTPSQLQRQSPSPGPDERSPPQDKTVCDREEYRGDGSDGRGLAAAAREEDISDGSGDDEDLDKPVQKQQMRRDDQGGRMAGAGQDNAQGIHHDGTTRKDEEAGINSRSQDPSETKAVDQKLKSELERIEREKQEMEVVQRRQEEAYVEKLREAKRAEDASKQKKNQEVEELAAEKERLEAEVRREKESAEETRRQLEEESRRTQRELEQKMRENQDVLKQKQDREVEEITAEKDRLEKEIRMQKEDAVEKLRRLEEEKQRQQRDLEQKMKDSEQQKEEELKRIQEDVDRVEEEKRKLQDELMAERHKMEQERRKADEERLIRAEADAEARDQDRGREQEELARLQREKDDMEEALRQEKDAMEKERRLFKQNQAEERKALELDRERMEKERAEMERIRETGEAGLSAEKARVIREQSALEESRREVADLERERRRLDEERREIEEVRLEAEKIQREKDSLLEEKKKFDDAKKDAEVITAERRKLQEEQRTFEEAREEAKKMDAKKMEADRERLEMEKHQLEIAKQEKDKFEMDRRNLEEEKSKLESVKRGEMDLVEFERQKLEREREVLEKTQKDREVQIGRDRRDLENSRQELEEQRRGEETKRKDEREMLEKERQQLGTKREEDSENLKNMMMRVQKLSERNTLLEREAEMMNSRSAVRDPADEHQNGHREIADRAPQELKGHSRSYVPGSTNQTPERIQQNGFTNRISNGIHRGSKIPSKAAAGDESVGSDGDSDSPVIEEDAVPGLRIDTNTWNGSTKKEAWTPNSRLSGVNSRSRGLPKQIRSLNTNGNGNPSSARSAANTYHELLEEYDGLDYSSSSMGEGEEEEDGLLADMSPVGAPLAPLVSGPLSSTLQLPQTGATNTPAQGVIQDLRYRVARERQAARLAQNKVRQMGEEKEDILQRLDQFAKEKQHMKDVNLNLEKKLQTFIHDIEGERERRCSAELLLKKTKEHLTKKDHQLTDEHQVREQAELALCKMQVDFRMLQNTVQQLESEREQLSRQLIERENSHKYQQRLMETQQMKQEAIHETGSVVLLEAADESRKAAWSQSEKLKEELHSMKVEMERLQFRYKGNEGALTNQIQELESKLDDLRQEQIVNEDALHHASQAYHAQLMAVKMENGHLKASLEQEQHKEEEISKRVEDLQRENSRLQCDNDDLTKMHQELERATRTEIDRLDGLISKKQQELNHVKEGAKSNEKTAKSSEEKISHLKQQLGIANGALLDRTNQLNTFQREMDRKLLSEQGHDKVIHMEREEKAKAMAKADSLGESLRRAEEEISTMRKDLERVREQTHQKERDTESAKERLNSTITEVQKEKDQVRSLWEEKHASMAANLQSLKDSVARSQGDLRDKDSEIRSLHQQLTENERKLCLAEANLTVLQKSCDNHERENKDAQGELKDLRAKISQLEMNRGRLESQLEDLQKSLRNAEKRYTDTSDELVQAKKSLEHQEVDSRAMQELEREKARLEVAVEQERDRTHNLKMELDHALQMKNNLEVLLSQLKNSNVHMGEKLTLEMATKDLMSQEVEEHKELWETEIKSKSKLGLRLSQLHRSSVNQQGQIEDERHKTQKALDSRKQMAGKLEAEKERNHQLEQANTLLKSKLKLAKRRLKELEVPEAKIKNIQTDFERERFNLEAALATQRKQFENANERLEKDLTERQKLEQKNASLQLELASLQSLQKKKKDLSKENRRLEEELASTRRDIEDNYIEKGELEVYKKSLDLKTTHDLNEKLAQVNNYFDEQTRARDTVDKTQQDTEAEMRGELEYTVGNLKSELADLQKAHSDLISKKETLETELQRYKSLFKKESEKTQRLEDELEQLQRQMMELESKIRIEKQRTLQRAEPPTLDVQPQKYRAATQQKPSSVDDITHQVREELNRSISRHMENATVELDSQFRGQSPVLGGYSSQMTASPDTFYMSLLKKNYFV